MPEVIEVLQYADFLRTKLKNNKITEVNVINGRYKKHPDSLINLADLKAALPIKVANIESKGKFLYMEFANNQPTQNLYLFSTLGLSGGWLYKSKEGKIQFGHLLKYIAKDQLDQYHKEALAHCNVEFKTEKGTLYFYDTLSYGTLKVATTNAELQKKLSTIGPDISQQSTTFAVFKAQMEKKVNEEKLIGNILMNQKIVAGIGNYLRADVLWLCKMSPFRKMKNITEDELKCLWQNCQMLIWAKYDEKRGLQLGFITSDRPKTPSAYKREFYVYQQTTDPQGYQVKKEELYDGSQKRFIHWSPDVQN
jgi:formamidopyrimidine-DNA glycosylase